jgi:hypothetical protein
VKHPKAISLHADKHVRVNVVVVVVVHVLVDVGGFCLIMKKNKFTAMPALSGALH